MSKASEVEIRFLSEGPDKPSSNSNIARSSVTAKAPNSFALSSMVPVRGLEFWMLRQADRNALALHTRLGSLLRRTRPQFDSFEIGDSMKPVLYLRIASILTLIHSILHTIGGVFGKPPSARLR